MQDSSWFPNSSFSYFSGVSELFDQADDGKAENDEKAQFTR
jgi:hypothetical protein